MSDLEQLKLKGKTKVFQRNKNETNKQNKGLGEKCLFQIKLKFNPKILNMTKDTF